MSSNKCDIKYYKDKIGDYYLDKNNLKIYYEKDKNGNYIYWYFDEHNKKHLIPNKIENNNSETKETEEKNNTEIENIGIGKLSTYLTNELYSLKYIDTNIKPNEVKNIIKIAIKKFINPESSRCQAKITTKNYSYTCNAPTKPGSKFCGRKHKNN